MFIRIFNLVFFIIYTFHFLNIIFIPNEIRYSIMALYLVINLLGFIQKNLNLILNFLIMMTFI